MSKSRICQNWGLAIVAELAMCVIMYLWNGAPPDWVPLAYSLVIAGAQELEIWGSLTGSRRVVVAFVLFAPVAAYNYCIGGWGAVLLASFCWVDVLALQGVGRKLVDRWIARAPSC